MKPQHFHRLRETLLYFKTDSTMWNSPGLELFFESFNSFKCVEENPSIWIMCRKCKASDNHSHSRLLVSLAFLLSVCLCSVASDSL